MEYTILITAITALHRPEAAHRRVGRSEQGVYTVHNVVFIKFKIAVVSCAAVNNLTLLSIYINS